MPGSNARRAQARAQARARPSSPTSTSRIGESPSPPPPPSPTPSPPPSGWPPTPSPPRSPVQGPAFRRFPQVCSAAAVFKPKSLWNHDFMLKVEDFPPLPSSTSSQPSSSSSPPAPPRRPSSPVASSSTPAGAVSSSVNLDHQIVGRALSPSNPAAWVVNDNLGDPLDAEGLDDVSLDSAFWSDDQIDQLLGPDVTPPREDILVTPQAVIDYRQEPELPTPSPSPPYSPLLVLPEVPLTPNQTSSQFPSSFSEASLPTTSLEDFSLASPRLPSPLFSFASPSALDYDTDMLSGASLPVQLSANALIEGSLLAVGARKRPAFVRPGTPFPEPPSKRRRLLSPTSVIWSHGFQLQGGLGNTKVSSLPSSPISSPMPGSSLPPPLWPIRPSLPTAMSESGPSSPPPPPPPSAISVASPTPSLEVAPSVVHPAPQDSSPSPLDAAAIIQRLQEQQMVLRTEQAAMAQRLADMQTSVRTKKKSAKSKLWPPLTNELVPLNTSSDKPSVSPVDLYTSRLFQPYPRIPIEVQMLPSGRLSVRPTQLQEAENFLGRWEKLADSCLKHAMHHFPDKFAILLQPSIYTFNEVHNAVYDILSQYSLIRSPDELWAALRLPKEEFLRQSGPLFPPLLRLLPGQPGWDKVLTFRYASGLKLNDSMVMMYYLTVCPFLARLMYIPMLQSGQTKHSAFIKRIMNTFPHPFLGLMPANELVNATRFHLVALAGMSLAKACRPSLFNHTSNTERRLWFLAPWVPTMLKDEIYPKFNNRTDDNYLPRAYWEQIFLFKQRSFWIQKMSTSGIEAQSLDVAMQRMFSSSSLL